MTSDDSGSSMALFNKLIETQEQQKREICERVIPHLKKGIVPTPDSVREDINRAGNRRSEILRNHAYWKEQQLKLGLESLVRAAHQAYVDICRHNAALGSLTKARDFKSHVDYTVGYAMQKDVMAYCSLSSGVVGTLRRIERSDIRDQISCALDKYSSSNVTKFIKNLRNNLSHGSVVIPKWLISFGDPRKHVGSMMYPKEELLGFGEWGSDSKQYVSNAEGDHVDLALAIGEHFDLLNELERTLQDLFARNVLPEEEDFYDIEDSYKRIQGSQWAHLLIDQFGKNKDPYDYLHKFFDPNTVREILRRPKHSKEQVDFIIGLKGAEYDWDDDLRSMLYRYFGVREN